MVCLHHKVSLFQKERFPAKQKLKSKIFSSFHKTSCKNAIYKYSKVVFRMLILWSSASPRLGTNLMLFFNEKSQDDSNTCKKNNKIQPSVTEDGPM